MSATFRATSHRFLVFLLSALAVAAGCDCDSGLRASETKLEVTPSSLDFGTVQVGRRVELSLQLRNAGVGRLSVSEVLVTSGAEHGFAVSSLLRRDCEGRSRGVDPRPELGAGECGRVTVSIDAVASGEFSGTVVVRSDDQDRPEIEVPLTATATEPLVTVCVLDDAGGEDPEHCSYLDGDTLVLPEVDFGTTARHSPVQRLVRVRSGAEAFELTGTSVVEGDDRFWLPNGSLVQALGIRSSVDFPVTFEPATGAHTGVLDITTSLEPFPSLKLDLRGDATGPRLVACVLGLDGSVDASHCSRPAEDPPFVPTIAFGPMSLGTTVTRVVRLLNEGQEPLAVAATSIVPTTASLSLPGDSFAGSIEPGAFHDVQVRHTPVGAAPLGAVLRIESDDGRHPSLDLPITSEVDAPEVRVCVLRDDGTLDEEMCSRLHEDPPFVPELDFGGEAWGLQIIRHVRVFNAGRQILTLEKTTLSGVTPDFVVAGGNLRTLLMAGQSHDIEMVFTPVSIGPVSTKMRIRSDDPRSPLVEVPVMGISEGPRLCVDPVPTLDFGTVTVGTSRTMPITVTNCGLVPFPLLSTEFWEDLPSTIEYTTSPLPPAYRVLQPAESLPIQVTYRPVQARVDDATFEVESQYQRISVRVTGKGAGGVCGDLSPVANAGPDQTVKPLTTVALDGRSSTNPRGGTLTYVWRVVSQPPNGRTVLQTGANPARPTFEALLAGEYVFELVVRDSAGCQSAPDMVSVRVVPDERVHVQLTWAQNTSDIDLHYVGPGGTPFTSGDAYYANKKPDWGRGNTVQPDGNRANDPSLDRDDLWGNGPENVNHDLPFDGTYLITTHYYCSREQAAFYCGPSQGPVDATIKVFVDGLEAFSETRRLSKRQMWDSAEVRVSGGGSRIEVVPLARPNAATTRGCACD